MSSIPRFEVLGIPDVPVIGPGDDIANVLIDRANDSGVGLEDYDVAVVASKAVSSAENRFVNLDEVDVSPEAWELHRQVPRKSPAVCELILRATNGNIHVNGSHILGILPNGMQLTSGGIDKIDDKTAALLPENSDASARKISESILERAGVHVAIVISDSEGRPDRQGAGAIALGSFGVPALRIPRTGKGSETYCDFLANTASLILGQRGTGYPFAIIRGLSYRWDTVSQVGAILNRPKQN